MKKTTIGVLSIICTIGLCFILIGGLTVYEALSNQKNKDSNSKSISRVTPSEEYAYNPDEDAEKDIDNIDNSTSWTSGDSQKTTKADASTIPPKTVDPNTEQENDSKKASAAQEPKGTIVTKKTLELTDFINNLKCSDYTLQHGETLSVIARRYESKCNPNSTIELITLKNNLSNPDEINPGTHLLIPEDIINNSTLYKVVEGDTWFKIAKNYYPEYDVESVMNLVVKINKLPNNDLPLGENVFLPKV